MQKRRDRKNVNRQMAFASQYLGGVAAIWQVGELTKSGLHG